MNLREMGGGASSRVLQLGCRWQTSFSGGTLNVHATQPILAHTVFQTLGMRLGMRLYFDNLVIFMSQTQLSVDHFAHPMY